MEVDAPQGTLLPGLFDAHAHLAFDAGPDPVGTLTRASEGELLAIAQAAAVRALRSGVTTVRDCGGRGDVIHRLKAKLRTESGPTLRVLASGRALTTVRGHCWFLGGEAADGDALLQRIEEELERGADLVKIMATGGGITPGTDPTRAQFTEADLRRAAARVHLAGRVIGCHAHGTPGIANAARAGVDIIDHCTFLTAEGPRFDESVAALVAEAGCRVAPVLATLAQPLASGQLIGNMRALGLTAREYFEQRLEVIRRLRANGVVLLAGSDAGDIYVLHDAVLTELAMLVRVGLSPEEAIAAASLEPARVVGLDAELGSI